MSTESGRRTRRASYSDEVALEERGRHVFLPARNLSAEGVFLASPEPPAVGARVRVVLSLPPEGRFVRATGVVVRHATRGEPPGFAIRFEGLDEQCRRDLEGFVEGSSR